MWISDVWMDGNWMNVPVQRQSGCSDYQLHCKKNPNASSSALVSLQQSEFIAASSNHRSLLCAKKQGANHGDETRVGTTAGAQKHRATLQDEKESEPPLDDRWWVCGSKTNPRNQQRHTDNLAFLATAERDETGVAGRHFEKYSNFLSPRRSEERIDTAHMSVR